MKDTLGQSQWGFYGVSWALNMLTWHRVNEERDDKSFIGVERVSWGWNSSALFSKYKCVRNWDMKLAMRLALEDYRRHQKWRERTGERDAARWGRSAPPLCRLAPCEGIPPRACIPPSPPRMHLHPTSKSVWSKGLRWTPWLYKDPYTPWSIKSGEDSRLPRSHRPNWHSSPDPDWWRVSLSLGDDGDNTEATYTYASHHLSLCW
jgi:hypothetical protein